MEETGNQLAEPLADVLGRPGTRRVWLAATSFRAAIFALLDLALSANNSSGSDGVAEAAADIVDALPGLDSTFRQSVLTVMDTDSLNRMERGYQEGFYSKALPSSADPAGDVARLLADGLGPANVHAFIGALSVHGARSSSLVPAAQLQRDAVVVISISVFEAYLAGLVEAYFLQVPSAMAGDEKVISGDDLGLASTLDDLRQLIASRRARSLLNETAEGWGKWFSDRIGIRVGDLGCDWTILTEAFERRHVLVHNEGAADARYVKKTGAPIALGTKLSTDGEYISKFLSEVIVAATALLAEWWTRLAPATGKAVHPLVLLTFFDLQARSLWDTAARTGEAVLRAERLPSDVRASIQVRTWNASKRASGVAAIRNEVTAWRDAAGSVRISLEAAALLDDLSLVFELLPPLLDTGEETVIGIAREAIYSDVVRDERWRKIVATHIPAASDNWPPH
jgi:hypothetical protein